MQPQLVKTLKQTVPKQLRTLEELCQRGTSSGLLVLKTFHKVPSSYCAVMSGQVVLYFNALHFHVFQFAIDQCSSLILTLYTL